MIDDKLIVDVLVVGDDHNRIRVSEGGLAQVNALAGVAILTEFMHEWIMELDERAKLFEQTDHVEGRAFPHVVDVTLVGNAKYPPVSG